MFLVLGQNFGFQPSSSTAISPSGVLTTVDFFCVLLLMTTRVLSAGNHASRFGSVGAANRCSAAALGPQQQVQQHAGVDRAVFKPGHVHTAALAERMGSNSGGAVHLSQHTVPPSVMYRWSWVFSVAPSGINPSTGSACTGQRPWQTRAPVSSSTPRMRAMRKVSP